MDLRGYLLSKKGYGDALGNHVVFSSTGLNGEESGEEIWLFLDEGLRCGGRSAKIPCTLGAIEGLLLGCKKQELWDVLREDIEKQ